MNRYLLLGVAAIALVVSLTGTATATSLAITDPNFANVGTAIPATDIPVDFGSYDDQGNWTSPNDFYNGNVLGGSTWQQVVPGDGSCDAVAWRPSAAAFPGAPANGLHVLASDYQDLTNQGMPPSSSEVAIAQNLSYANPVLGTIQPGLTYTLTVSLGSPIGKKFTGANVGFGDIQSESALPMQEIDGLAGADNGNLVDFSISFNANDVIGPGVSVGDQIAIFLYLSSSGDSADTVATNVRVDVTGGAVPEPSTLALLAAGGLSLLAYAWRKRK